MIDMLVCQARAGVQLCVIEGEPGLGVSTLLQRVADELVGFQLRRVVADPWEHAAPLSLIRAAVPIQPGHETHIDEVGLRAAILDDLAAVGDLPLALLFDNAHLAHVADLDFCVELCQTVKQPLLMVLAGRTLPTSVGAVANHVAVLAPKTTEESISIARHLLGANPGPRLQRHLLAAGGVPSLIVDLVDAAVTDELLEESENEAETTVDLVEDDLPASVSLRVAKRLRRLGSASERLATAAAVCGVSVDAGVAVAVASAAGDVTQGALRRVVDAGFLQIEANRLTWRHELVREAVLAGLSPQLRRDIERSVATVLIDRKAPDQFVLEHLIYAGAPKEELTPWQLRIADTGAIHERVKALRWLVDFDHEDDQVERKTRLVHLCRYAAAIADFAELSRSTAELRLLDPIHPEPWLLEVRAFIGANDMASAASMAKAALGVVTDDAGRAKLAAAVVLSNMMSGNATDQGALLEQATLHATTSEDGGAIAAVFTVRSRVAASRFSGGQALIDAERACGTGAVNLEILQYLPHHFLSLARMEHDDLAGALHAVREGRTSAHELGVSWPDSILLGQAAAILWECCRGDEAVAAASDAIAQSRAARLTPAMLPAYAVLVQSSLAEGNIADAVRLLDEASASVDSGRGPAGGVGLEQISLAQSACLRAMGRDNEARRVLGQCWESLVATGNGSALVQLAVPVVVDAFETSDLDRIAATAKVFGALPDDASLSTRCVSRWCQAVYRRDEGEVRSVLTSFPSVRVRSHRALVHATESIFKGSSKRANEDVVLREFTPTEKLVAAALADGCSNLEIAGRCFMKVRTVETHVQRILKKVGARNRTQAIQRIRSN